MQTRDERKPLKILLVYPECPQTFWSLTHALQFLGKATWAPPLGLLTVAAMLPAGTERRLLDLNVCSLPDSDLAWADYVFISAMAIQRESARKLIDRCKAAGRKIVAGGPLFTNCAEDFADVDHLVLNEAEAVFPQFWKDLMAGEARRLYSTDDFADMHTSPLPAYELLDPKPYGVLGLQFSRGCPNQCEFCNVTSLFGHRARTKTTAQIIAELDQIYALGWKGKVSFVDDNLMCDKRFLKTELLPAIIQWQRDKKGISFHTQISMNVADDPELMNLMYEAGIDWIFIGIETPEEESLRECRKRQNLNRSMVQQIRDLQERGFQILGGFIIGFDHDQEDIFARQLEFIQDSGIVMAMVGLLQAPQGTPLYDRLKRENRLLREDFTPDSVVCDTNFITRMDRDELIGGYKQLVNRLYEPKTYYDRVKTLLSRLRKPKHPVPLSWEGIQAMVRCFVRLGFLRSGRAEFWTTFLWTCLRKPEAISAFVTLAIFGFHFRKVYGDVTSGEGRGTPATANAPAAVS